MDRSFADGAAVTLRASGATGEVVRLMPANGANPINYYEVAVSADAHVIVPEGMLTPATVAPIAPTAPAAPAEATPEPTATATPAPTPADLVSEAETLLVEAKAEATAIAPAKTATKTAKEEATDGGQPQ